MNILLVNWGTDTAEHPLRESINLGKHQIYLATSRKIPEKIRRIFSEENLIFTNPYDSTILIQDTVRFCDSRNLKFDVVTTFFEMSVYHTAVLAEYLGLIRRLPLANAFQTSVNKYLMRMSLKNSGISQPRFLYFNASNIDRAYEFFCSIAKPVVIKPVYSGHSYGSRLISYANRTQFEELFRQAVADFSKGYDEWMQYVNPASVTYLVEEFIEGNVFSFDGVVGNLGEITFLGNAEFEMDAPPSLQQVGHTLPIANLGTREIKRCMSYTENVIKILGLKYCGFHCELKYFKGGPYLIEISGRLPGGSVLESYQSIAKINIFDLFYSIFEGRERPLAINKNVFRSESKKGIFKSVKIGKVSKAPKSRKVVLRKYSYQVRGLKKGVTILNLDKIELWALEVIVKSKTLDAKEVKKIRDKILIKAANELRIDKSLLAQIAVLFERLNYIKWKFAKRLKAAVTS